MVRRALIGLAAFVGVASAQPVPNATWSLPSPRTAPTVEWSPNGSYVVLSTNSSVEVLDGTTLKIKWARTVGGANPSFLSMYPHPDRAHFATDSKSVWVRSAAGNVYTQLDSVTGAVLGTHTYSDWVGDYVVRPVGTQMVAIQLSVAGGVETLNYRTYDPTTWSLVKSGTATHAYIAGVDIPVGAVSGRNSVGFYDKLINAATGQAIGNLQPVGTTAYHVAFDPDNGILQTVVNSSTGDFIGNRRIIISGAETWSNTSNLLGTNVGFAKATGLTLGITPLGSSFGGFNYLTGATLYNSNAGMASTTFTFDSKSIRQKDGHILTTASGTSGMDSPLLLADNSGVTASGTSIRTSGFASIEAFTTGVAFSGNGNFTGGVAQATGASLWSGSGNTAAVGIYAAKTGGIAVAVSPTQLDVFDPATGTVSASYSGAYTRAAWVGTSQIVAAKADGTADLLDYSGSAVTFNKNINKVGFKSGLAITNDNQFAVGYADGKIHVVRMSTLGDFQTTYGSYDSSWDSFFRILPTTDGKLALLEKTGTGLKWTIYKLVSGILSADSAVTFDPSFTPTAGASLAGDTAVNSKGLVSAFFAGNGISDDGTPTSELRIVRTSDSKVLGTYANVFSNVSGLRFSPDGSSLYVATGGSVDSGPAELIALKVSSWLDSLTPPNPASGASGGTARVVVKLVNASPAGGTVVNLSATGGATVPATVTIPAFASSANVTVTLPAVGTDTPVTVSATITGFPETVSTTLTAKAPVLTSQTFSPSTVGAGTSSTATISLTGTAPTGGTTVSLVSSSAKVHVPASVVVPEGTHTATYTITTDSSTMGVDANISATLSGKTVKTVLHVTGAVLGVSVSPATVTAGGSSTGTVTLSPAASTDITVNLSSNSGLAPVQSTVTIPMGATSATFPVNTPSSPTGASATITATWDSQVKTAALTVNATPLTLSLNPTTVVAGNNSVGTVSISPAATSDIVLTLDSSTASASVPSTVTIASGTTSATFPVTVPTSATAGSPVIHATWGSVVKSATLTVNQTPVSSLTLNPSSLPAGNSTTATVTIGGTASGTGQPVAISYTGTGVAGPSTVTIPSGSNSTTFTVTTTAALTGQAATVTATLGASTKTANLTITPSTVTAFTVTNPSITGGANSVGSITINAPAPTGGLVINLTNNKPTLIPGFPASNTITVPAGATSVNFSWASAPTLSTQVATYTAKIANVGPSATQTVVAPKVVSVVFANHTVAGGTAVSFTVTLDGPAPAGYSITLSSSNTARMTVTSPLKPTAGLTTATGTVNTTAGGATTVTLTATGVGGGTATDTLNLSS